jgi:hypothetical protein
MARSRPIDKNQRSRSADFHDRLRAHDRLLRFGDITLQNTLAIGEPSGQNEWARSRSRERPP